MSKEVWGWSHNEEWYHGTEDSREAAIEAGKRDWDGRPFWIARGFYPSPASFAPDVDLILEMMGEAASDEAGEAAENWPDCTSEAARELKEFLEGWVIKHCPINFYLIENSTKELISGVT